MSLRRYLPRIAIIAAAVASIATSQLWWSLEEAVPLDPIALDDRAPTSTIAIQATFEAGEGRPEDGQVGDVQLSLELAARDVTGVQPAQVEVELRSAARETELTSQVFTVGPGGRIHAFLILEAWPDCSSPTCIDDFTVTLRRRPVEGDPIIDVTGLIRGRVAVPGAADPPPGSRIVVDATNLGPVP